MKFVIDIPPGFVPEDPAGVIYALRDALEVAEIPANIVEVQETEGVYNYLDCSTLHVTPRDMKLLEEREDSVIAYPNEYGAWVYVPSEDLHEDMAEHRRKLSEEGFSEGFTRVLDFAREKSCVWIKFDGDGHIWDELVKNEEDWK